MADKRRLQGEIERTLKRVSDGRQSFQEIMDKFQSASNQTQKEKFEADLKREIKKLQRLRDQIKTWLTNNEIKDKRTLLDARKEIESDMERFKVIEKETKTKMYSKEGLCMEQKRDPRDKEKEDMADWLRGIINILSEQIEKYEYEIENLSNAQKRKRGIDKDKQDIIDDKRHHLENHKWHISKLEACMRLLDNDRLDLDSLKAVKESVVFYCDSHDEPDFMEDDSIYDDLNLDEVADMSVVGTLAGGHDEHNDSLREIDDDDEEREREEEVPGTGENTAHHGASSRSSSPPQSMSSRVSAEERSVASSTNSFEPRERHKSETEQPSTPLKLPGLPIATRGHNNSQSGGQVELPKSGAGDPVPSSTPVPASQPPTLLASPIQSLPPQPPPSQPESQPPLPIRQLSQPARTPGMSLSHMHSVLAKGESEPNVESQGLDADGDSLPVPVQEESQQNRSELPASPSAFTQAAMQVNAVERQQQQQQAPMGSNSNSVGQPMSMPPSSLVSQSALMPQPQSSAPQQQLHLQMQQSQAASSLPMNLGQNVPFSAPTSIALPPPVSSVAQQQQQQQPNPPAPGMAGLPTSSLLQRVSEASMLDVHRRPPGLSDGISSTPNNLSVMAQQVIHAQQSLQQRLQQQQQQQQKPPGPAQLLGGSMGPSSQQQPTQQQGASMMNQHRFGADLGVSGQHQYLPPHMAPPPPSLKASASAGMQAPMGLGIGPRTGHSASDQYHPLFDSYSQLGGPGPGSGNAPPMMNRMMQSPSHRITQRLSQHTQLLENAWKKLPIPTDSERLRYHLTRTQSPHVPSYYVTSPRPYFFTEEYYMKLDVQTLFFIFYYFEGTKAQYLAAKTLKKMSWRFHSQQLYWFQRHEEPKTIGPEFEMGTYIYFDFEQFKQKKKDNFKFEYKYLEDIEM